MPHSDARPDQVRDYHVKLSKQNHHAVCNGNPYKFSKPIANNVGTATLFLQSFDIGPTLLQVHVLG